MKILVLLWFFFVPWVWADDYAPITVWQTVPFIKGQDLCQFHDAYAHTGQATQRNLSGQLIEMLYAGAEPTQWVTLHVQITSGRTYNYQATGKPEKVMQAIATQWFTEFQHTQFPSKVKMGQRTLVLVGAPGVPISHTRSSASAQRACQSIQARLPTAEEYEFMASLGNSNQGIRTQGRVWALGADTVLAPDLPNPSPVRSEAEVRGSEIYYYCVR